MSRDNYDLLIDQLLREVIGGDRPRDMTARVLAQAKIMDRFRRRSWIATGSAIAAGIALAVMLIRYWPGEYPNPTADAQVFVQDDGPVQRGPRLETADDKGTVQLGGYVNIVMAPQSALTIGGGKFEERVVLNGGQIDVKVAKHKGQFDIAVGPATVHVTGTQFSVKVAEENTPTAWLKKLQVAVTEGSVEVQNVPGAQTQTLATGENRDFTISTILKATNGGLLAAAQQGARTGNRGGFTSVVPRVPPALTTQPAPPPSYYSPAAAGRPVQLLTTPGAMTRTGKPTRTGDLYYLENKDGNFFMFEQAAVAIIHPEWLTLTPDQTLTVTWTDGAVSRINAASPSSTSAQPR